MTGFARGLVLKQRHEVTRTEWSFTGMFSNQSEQTVAGCFFNQSREKEENNLSRDLTDVCYPALCDGCMFIRFSAFVVIGQILLRLGLGLSSH